MAGELEAHLMGLTRTNTLDQGRRAFSRVFAVDVDRGTAGLAADDEGGGAGAASDREGDDQDDDGDDDEAGDGRDQFSAT